MDVRCDRCETEYELDESSVSDAGTSVQCTTCGHLFIVARRPSSPLHQVALTPPAGMSEPAVPEWTLSSDDGKVHRFRDLNTLQKWIVERKVGRTDRLSRAGGPWLALGEMDELAAFFQVVDEADRARAAAATPTRPTPPGPRPIQRAPSGRIDGPTGGARRTGPEDGPTVPNRPLPDLRSSSPSIPRGAERTPALGTRAAAPNRTAAAGARTPGPDARGAVTPPPAATGTTGSTSLSGAVTRPMGNGAASQAIQSARPSTRGSGRPELVSGLDRVDHTAPIEGDFRLPTNRGRNVFIAVAVIAVAAGGAYLWSQQGGSKTVAPVVATPPAPTPKAAPVAAAPPAPTPEPTPAEVTAPNPAKAPPTPVANPGPSTAAGRTAPPPSGKVASHSPDGATGKAGGAGNYDRLVADADRLLDRGQAGKAEKVYEQALNAKPDGVAALTGIAYVMLDKQRHFKAIDMFRRALDVQPTYGPALFGIAESYRGRGDLSQALGAYRQYLAISPSGADAPAARRQIKDLETANTQASAGKSAKPDTGSAGDD